jgi:hypothetical protein
MSTVSPIHLLDRKTGLLVEAHLIDGLTREDVEKAEAIWKPFLDKHIKRMEEAGIPKNQWPQHRHWNWREKYDVAEREYLSHHILGIECQSQIQGLMLVLTAGKNSLIEGQRGKPIVYVHFLAAAPWNLASIVGEPHFSLVGSILLAAAIHLSIEEEFQGRIGLHSLPQADDWYKNACGMTDLGPDQTVQNLRYFEMTPEQASEFLR